MTKKTWTREEAMTEVVAYLMQEDIPGSDSIDAVFTISENVNRVRGFGWDSFYFQHKLAWSVSCTIIVTFRLDLEYKKKAKDETGEFDDIPTKWVPSVCLNWSATHRSTFEAVAAVELYRKCTVAACTVESILGGYEIIEEEAR